jgi:hypothetical protein
MPLRDMLRGVTTVADLTEEILEPATALLPGPVQSTFKSALATFEGAGASAATPRIDPDDIAKASAYLKGLDISHDALETFVNVLAFAWERGQAGHDGQHLLFSETVAAASLVAAGKADAGKGATTEAHHASAAAILTALRRSTAASRLPGIPLVQGPITPGPKERAAIDRTLLAACAWLLSERALDLGEEERLLGLALALVEALGDDVLGEMDDQTLLAEQLQSLADHL